MTTAANTFPLLANTYYLDEDALIMAREVARGDYQRAREDRVGIVHEHPAIEFGVLEVI